MNITIKKLLELPDDWQTLLVADHPCDVHFTEVYARKVVYNSLSFTAFTIRAKTFYKVILSHIPKGKDFVLSSKISQMGILYNYNSETKELFLYNCTQNQIYIEEDENIGVVVDG